MIRADVVDALAVPLVVDGAYVWQTIPPDVTADEARAALEQLDARAGELRAVVAELEPLVASIFATQIEHERRAGLL